MRHEVPLFISSVFFLFFRKENPNSMSHERRKWNKASYIGREEKELLRDGCPPPDILGMRCQPCHFFG